MFTFINKRARRVVNTVEYKHKVASVNENNNDGVINNNRNIEESLPVFNVAPSKKEIKTLKDRQKTKKKNKKTDNNLSKNTSSDE